jgi:anaerobic selenocysteine-containing dehydrogenase
MSSKTVYSHEQLLQSKIPALETGIEIKKTLCAICGNQCGIDAYVKDGRVIKVEGTETNPTNRGTLCSKGQSNRQYIYNPERLHTPLVRTGEKGTGQFSSVTWDEALDRIADKLLKIKQESGPESVVFFAGYPKWFRPWLQRLTHSFGSPNFCSESSTCFFATVVANRLTYGCFSAGPDAKNAACILNWSTNPYNGVPRIGPFQDAMDRGAKIIDVGPLTTPLSRHADIHLRIRPGTSGALALGMAHIIIEEGLYDREFVENWTLGFDEYRSYAQTFTPIVTEGITGVAADKIREAARLYATTKPAAMMNSANTTVHHTNGVQNHRAIISLIGLTGNFDRKGGNQVIEPISYYHRPTGLPNRQHEFELPRPWEEMAPRIGQDNFPVWSRIVSEAQATQLPFQIQSGKPYPIRAVVGFGLNHRMWPASDFMKESLEKVEFFVNIDLFMTDSAKLADVVLPACSSFEREELMMYPSRYSVWTEPIIPPVGESRSDVDIITDLARRLTPEDTLLAQGHEAALDWIFEPSGIKMSEIKASPGGTPLKKYVEISHEKYRQSGFPTPSGKMEFTSLILKEAGVDPLPTYREPKQSPVSTPELAREYSLILTTGARLPMFIHSRMYRVPWTRRLRPDPMVDMNPKDAKDRGITHEEWVTLCTQRRAIRVRANLTELVPPGVVSMFHDHPNADVNSLIDPDYRDPISGFPGCKSLLCDVKKSSGLGGDR